MTSKTADEFQIVSSVLKAQDHFDVLGFGPFNKDMKVPEKSELRKSFMSKSRVCHPDKSDHPESTQAFQKLALAYETLSDQSKCNEYIHTLKYSTPKESIFSSKNGMNVDVDGMDLSEALGLFATVAMQFGAMNGSIERSFFDKAADAVTFVDIYMKRKQRQEQQKNGSRSSQKESDNSGNNNNDNLMENIASGLRVAGVVAGFVGIAASFFGENSNNSSRKRER